MIEASPAGGQRTGLPFVFDGSGSVFDPLAEATCFDWTLSANLPVFDASAGGCAVCEAPGSSVCSNDCFDRGPAESIVSLHKQLVTFKSYGMTIFLSELTTI
jgi:hypothetical protein